MNKIMRAIIDNNRRNFTFLFFICLYFSIIPASLSAESLNCELTAGGYKLAGSTAKGYTIAMADAGFSRMHSPGDPALPEKIIELKVPQDGVVSNLELTVDGADITILPELYTIVPQDPVLLDAIAYWGEGKSIVDGKNTYVYGADEFFPGETVKLLPTVTKKELVRMDGKRRIYRLVRYVRLAFRPFAYNPAARQLKLTRSASVTVRYSVAALEKISLPAAPADYVIITTNAIVSNSTMLASFVRMKEEGGHMVRIVTEDDFDSLTGQAPNGRAEKIRRWLMDNYLALGIDYVLLIGDPDPDDPLDDTADDTVGDIPMKMCYPTLVNPTEWAYPNDYFYRDLVGNWDLDGDLLFGEPLAIDHAKSPSPLIDPDTFSARWTGKVYIDYAENYTFTAQVNDGVRVYLDGNPVPFLDSWTDKANVVLESAGVSGLSVGLHDITVEYYQNTGDGMIKLYWRSASAIPNDVVIPADHLYHYNLATGMYVPGGLDAVYYNSIDPSGSWAMAGVEIIDNVWMTGDAGPGGFQQVTQVSVGRIPVYNDGYATLDDILIKIINYETDPGDISWRRSILLPMKPTDSTNKVIELAEAVKANVADPIGFSSFRIYEEDYAPSGPTPELWPCTVENVVGEWQKHYGAVTWRGHGGPDNTGGIMDTVNVANLDDVFPSIVFEASCNNGFPEQSNNLGYSLLKQGAVATISGTRTTAGGYFSGNILDSNNPNLAYFFTSFLLDNGGAPLAVGEALKKVQDNERPLEINQMAYNLYGDPDCYLLTTHPRLRPVAEAGGPYACNEGESVVLDAAGSDDPEGGTLEYRWNLKDDGVFYTDWSSDPTYTIDHCLESVVVTVQVRNEIGCVSTDSASITVTNIPPTVELGPDQTVYVNVTTRFSGTAADPGNDQEAFEWDFGDGTPTRYGPSPNHTYTAEGTYTVTLTVRDTNGGVGSDTLQVTVAGICPLSNENPARPWTKKSGYYTLQTDTSLKTEGNISLKLSGTGYMVCGTPVFSANEIRNYSDLLSLDIYMPSPAANPAWLGQVQLFINCPSAHVYNRYLGQVELNGYPLDTWNTINFNLADGTVDLFTGWYNDIQISVAVNTSQSASNPYRIDFLRFNGSIVVKPPAPAASRLENAWSAATATPTYLTLNSASEDAPVYCQTLHTDWTSQQWIMEPVPGFPDRARLKCAWNGGGTDYYLTATGTSGSGEGDPVVGKALHADWASQMWIVEPGRGGSTRFKSAWSMSTYLTVKSTDGFSEVVCQPNHPEWSSQEWNVK